MSRVVYRGMRPGMRQMRVLVVEDDVALGLFLQKGIGLEGHAVACVGDGEAALDHAASERPDLMVLDLGLPKRDGVDVLRAMQGLYPGMAVIVLTGRAQVEERVHCLNLGADDLLMKPFSLHELTARCRALLRRREQFADPLLRAGDVVLNRMERKVTRAGSTVDLTTKEFALLEFLLQRRGRCCSRSELLREVWQMSPDAGTNVVDVYVNYLRKKLAAACPALEDGASGAVIETVRGEGYLIGSVAEPASASARKGARSQVSVEQRMAPAADRAGVGSLWLRGARSVA
jgi:DNA-binding response OmpR family regulator